MAQGSPLGHFSMMKPQSPIAKFFYTLSCVIGEPMLGANWRNQLSQQGVGY
jgi:hypothetical protein